MYIKLKHPIGPYTKVYTGNNHKQSTIFQLNIPLAEQILIFNWPESKLSIDDKEACVCVWRQKKVN